MKVVVVQAASASVAIHEVNRSLCSFQLPKHCTPHLQFRAALTELLVVVTHAGRVKRHVSLEYVNSTLAPPSTLLFIPFLNNRIESAACNSLVPKELECIHQCTYRRSSPFLTLRLFCYFVTAVYL